MAKLDEVLKLVRLYEEKYRHPSLTRFSVSNKYDLFPWEREYGKLLAPMLPICR